MTTKLTNHCHIRDVSGRSPVIEIRRSNARVQSRVVDHRIPHAQRHHVVTTADVEAARVVRRGAAGEAGARVQLAVDGRSDEVDVPVSVGRTPAVWRHTVHREVGL